MRPRGPKVDSNPPRRPAGAPVGQARLQPRHATQPSLSTSSSLRAGFASHRHSTSYSRYSTLGHLAPPVALASLSCMIKRYRRCIIAPRFQLARQLLCHVSWCTGQSSPSLVSSCIVKSRRKTIGNEIIGCPAYHGDFRCTQSTPARA